MTTMNVETYGPGGYDPSKPNGNVTATKQVPVAPEVANEDALRARADNAIDGLATIANSSGTLTTAQLSSAVRLLAKAVAALIRLQLRRLDATD